MNTTGRAPAPGFTLYRRFGKRLLDFTVAAAALIVLSPLMILEALIVLVTLGRPVLLRQPRPGWNGHVFNLIKFRTMTQARGPDGSLLPDAQRLPRVGRWLRALSLDELPTLVNVLLGEMSLVGPRPLLVQYLDRYTSEQARRHEVRPGITGWAQVNGRNAISWDERFALDLWYVDHWSFGLDLRILAKTVGMVLRGEGISAEGHATMPEFHGTARNR